MSEFKNMKIEITDKEHLRDVCDVLESMGYDERGVFFSCDSYIITRDHGVYFPAIDGDFDFESINLSDLIKMRDEVKAESKEG
ncbi:hypothetical protein F937_01756 [Acinetobacter calcoaceticus ANC 3680]|uniref:hypothetical protein n=1 Tax=Acinetobacter calcoaceticus TaxID=471 RepID=UPI0002D0C4BF|nr:hypothetical protein [Acinetobacter calcoaceticus]ENV92362.1 hypothetical protein F937_01756 [Acinetobacter calcoaceticus ANC 3680]